MTRRTSHPGLPTTGQVELVNRVPLSDEWLSWDPERLHTYPGVRPATAPGYVWAEEDTAPVNRIGPERTGVAARHVVSKSFREAGWRRPGLGETLSFVGLGFGVGLGCGLAIVAMVYLAG